MSYNPYANAVDDSAQSRLHQPQPQRTVNPQQPMAHQYQQPQVFQPQQQQYQQPQYQQNMYGAQPQAQHAGQAPVFNNFFNDPTGAMAFQVGQQAMNAGQQYMGKFVQPGTFKPYFKVSNSYVMSKLLLILFPFTNKNWMRSPRRADTPQGDPNAVSAEQYAYPLEDKNAPDYYIPLMGIVTYILITAMIAGFHGEFTPELFGLKTSSTLAYLLLDLGILKVGLYMLNISSNTYDLIAYVGYKLVPAVLNSLFQNMSGMTSLNWLVFIYLLIAYGFFELRAVRFNLFGGINTMNTRAIKKSNYFLFVYAFLIQGTFLYLLSI